MIRLIPDTANNEVTAALMDEILNAPHCNHCGIADPRPGSAFCDHCNKLFDHWMLTTPLFNEYPNHCDCCAGELPATTLSSGYIYGEYVHCCSPECFFALQQIWAPETPYRWQVQYQAENGQIRTETTTYRTRKIARAAAYMLGDNYVRKQTVKTSTARYTETLAAPAPLEPASRVYSLSSLSEYTSLGVQAIMASLSLLVAFLAGASITALLQ